MGATKVIANDPYVGGGGVGATRVEVLCYQADKNGKMSETKVVPCGEYPGGAGGMMYDSSGNRYGYGSPGGGNWNGYGSFNSGSPFGGIIYGGGNGSGMGIPYAYGIISGHGFDSYTDLGTAEDRLEKRMVQLEYTLQDMNKTLRALQRDIKKLRKENNEK